MLYLLLLLLFCSPADAKVLICGVCKDVSASLDNTIQNIEALGKQFEDYAVVVYENNSNDDTAAKLQAWASANSHVSVLSENLPAHQLCCSRTEKIANARNKLLELVSKKKYQKFKHLIMADLDFKTPWPIQEIVDSVKVQGDWDCISANGITSAGTYYDRFAFRSKEQPFGPELFDSRYWPEFDRTWFTLPREQWLKVFSGFGGLAIYKTATITKFAYSGAVTPDLKWYYKQIIKVLDKQNPQLACYLSLNHKPYIHFRKNCAEWQAPDDDTITVCEHVALHAAMAKKGHGKFYINPKMVMQY